MSGKILRCGLLGRALAHSLSPQIHARLGNYEYRLYEEEPDDLPRFFQAAAFDCLNVTIPYKVEAMRYCATLSPQAAAIGSVNTLLKGPDGRLHGENTDYFGFARLLAASGAPVAGGRVLVLGSGGASRTARAVAADMGAAAVDVVSRSGPIDYRTVYGRPADVIVNTTPVGMYGHEDRSPVDVSRFPNLACVVDMIYNPLRPPLLCAARAAGLPHKNGMLMLVAQAFAASQLFQGRALAEELIGRVTDELSRERANIVLIGMPGSGKSTLGRLLAAMTGRPLADTDEMAEAAAGARVEDIIRSRGEAAFRALEADAVRAAASGHGGVVSVGGGAVLSEGNRLVLMRNGFFLHVRRETSLLCTKGRVLSSGPDALDALQRVRMPIYEALADADVRLAEGDPEGSARAALAAFLAARL